MAKYKAKGVVIKYGDSASPTTTIPQLAEVDINLGERELIEVTTHDSATSKEYIDTGLVDTPEINVRVVLDPADVAHEWLRAKHLSGGIGYLTFVLPDAGSAQWACSGFVRSASIQPGLKGSLDATFVFKCNVYPTFTA